MHDFPMAKLAKPKAAEVETAKKESKEEIQLKENEETKLSPILTLLRLILINRPPPEAAEMRGFQAVLGAFGGGKGQGGAPPSDFLGFSPVRGGGAGTEIASSGLGRQAKHPRVGG